MTVVRFQDSIAYRIQRAARLLRKHFLELGSSHGVDVTPEQWFILNKLRIEDGQSQTELSDEIFADRPNVTRMLAALERTELIHRRSDPDDGRKTRVFLTKLGVQTHDKFAALVPDARRKLFRGIDPDDLKAAERVLDLLEKNALTYDERD